MRNRLSNFPSITFVVVIFFFTLAAPASAFNPKAATQEAECLLGCGGNAKCLRVCEDAVRAHEAAEKAKKKLSAPKPKADPPPAPKSAPDPPPKADPPKPKPRSAKSAGPRPDCSELEAKLKRLRDQNRQLQAELDKRQLDIDDVNTRLAVIPRLENQQASHAGWVRKAVYWGFGLFGFLHLIGLLASLITIYCFFADQDERWKKLRAKIQEYAERRKQKRRRP